jgi:hypothetical protein
LYYSSKQYFLSAKLLIMQTTTPNKTELITLISADMRNRKLILGLEQAGLRAEEYYCDLTEFILGKAGFESVADEVYNWYQHTMEELLQVDAQEFWPQQAALAERMYELVISKQ